MQSTYLHQDSYTGPFILPSELGIKLSSFRVLRESYLLIELMRKEQIWVASRKPHTANAALYSCFEGLDAGISSFHPTSVCTPVSIVSIRILVQSYRHPSQP